MREQGYLGLFGMDLIVMPGGGHKFIEINARQPASIPMYTRMQRLAGLVPLSLLHIVEFLGIDYQLDLAKYLEQALAPQEYSQIFVRALNDSVVNYELRSGYYRLQGDNAAIDRASQQVKPNTIFLDEERDKALLFYADGYAIDQVDTAGMVILTPVKGRMLKYNEEAGRLQLRQGAYTGSGTLKPWIIESLKAIRDYQL
jgi:hypothetical protein